MKKVSCLLLLLAVVFLLSACVGNNAVAIARYPAAATKIEYSEYHSVRDKVGDVMVPFSARFVSEFLQQAGDSNTICSPLTAYFCLSLAAEIARGNSQSEILSALNLSDVEQLRACADVFYNASIRERKVDNQLVSKQTVTNSLWIDPELSVNENTLDVLANSHHAFSVEASFRHNNEQSNKALNDFIYKESNKLLKTNFQLDESTLFALVSTLYVKDLWDLYSDLSFTSESYNFANADGSTKTTKLLDSRYALGQLLEEESYKAFPVTSVSGYRLYFVVPNNGYDIKSVMNSSTVTQVLTNRYRGFNEDETVMYKTNVLFPEFTVENSVSLLNTLNKMGIKTAFSMNADLSGLLKDDSAFLSDAVQANKLIVNKKGFEGSSVVIIPGAGAPAPMETVYSTLTVDLSFGFILADSYNIPLFSGIIYNM